MQRIELINQADLVIKGLRLNSTIREDRMSPDLGTLSSEKFSPVGSIFLI